MFILFTVNHKNKLVFFLDEFYLQSNPSLKFQIVLLVKVWSGYVGDQRRGQIKSKLYVLSFQETLYYREN